MKALLEAHRVAFHAELMQKTLTLTSNGVASNADSTSEQSRNIARGIANILGATKVETKQKGQTAGSDFETICRNFIEASFGEFKHLRPGKWEVEKISGGKAKSRLRIADYEQYEHLRILHDAVKESPALKAALGADYLITPDIVVFRELEDDSEINNGANIINNVVANNASLRKKNGGKPILHASISCKWTIRSDRSQNSRSEGLNLIRNRKGHLPHVMVVTGEPMPSRIASIALGTGDIDCVYHFALPELLESVKQFDGSKPKKKSKHKIIGDNGVDNDGESVASDLLNMMISGKRLKDISDLPLDLAV